MWSGCCARPAGQRQQQRLRTCTGAGQEDVRAIAQRLEPAGVALQIPGGGLRCKRISLRQSGFGEVRILVDAGDRGAPMRDVVGASGGYCADLVGNVATSLDESAPRLDGLEVLPGLLRQLFGEVLDEPRPASGVQHPATWDSSSSSSWVFRAMRRAKLRAVPGKPPGMATSNMDTSTVSAPPTPRRRRPGWCAACSPRGRAGSSSAVTSPHAPQLRRLLGRRRRRRLAPTVGAAHASWRAS